MTGHGQASARHGDVVVDVEIRTVNNRFLKVSTKVSDVVAAFEPQIEGVVREYVKRGSLNVSVRISQMGRNNASKINQATLEDYISQSQSVAKRLGIQVEYQMGQMLVLPGVLETARQLDDEPLVLFVQQVLRSALTDLQSMREREGAMMADQLLASLSQIGELRNTIEARSPEVVSEYRAKIEQRVRAILSTLGHQSTEIDLLREVLLYADKCDVSEEITRLGSHLVQFRQAIEHDESQGRRLDFLIQELFRETNTIGSKANDSQISQWVVSIKTTIEQMRELIQNVE